MVEVQFSKYSTYLPSASLSHPEECNFYVSNENGIAYSNTIDAMIEGKEYKADTTWLYLTEHEAEVLVEHLNHPLYA